MPNELALIRQDMERLGHEFSVLLGNSISPERFTRVAITAIQNSRDLSKCSRPSIYAALMKCAEDRLLPDGREAAIIAVYNKDAGYTASYRPMVAGIRKKVMESGEIKDLRVECVYAGDEFFYELGDSPVLRHRPDLSGGGRDRPITHVYSIAVFNDGYLSRDIMSWTEILQIRDRYSRSKSGPWFDQVALPEMAKKTVVRHHSKTLPMSREALQVIERDNHLFDVKQHDDPEAPPPSKAIPKKDAILDVLDQLAGTNELQSEDHSHSVPIKNIQSEDQINKIEPTEEEQTGLDLAALNVQPQPTNSDEYLGFVEARIDMISSSAELKALRQWLMDTKQLREKFGVPVEDFNKLMVRLRAVKGYRDSGGS